MSVGDGPLEQLALRFRRGELDWPTTRSLATRPAIVARLTPDYAGALADWVSRMAARGVEEAPRVLATLLRDASAAVADDGPGQAVRRAADYAFLNVMAGELLRGADGEAYRAAREVGAHLLARARRTDDRDLLYRTHRALGALHLDPLAAHQMDGAWEARWRRWYRAGGEAVGGEGFPEPVEAFGIARGHFRDAAASVDGPRRGRALKGEVQTLEWLGRVTGEDTAGERAERAREALSLLDPLHDLPAVVYLVGVLGQAGDPVDPGVLVGLASLPVEALEERYGGTDALVAMSNLVSLLTPDQPELALELAVSAEPLTRRVGDANVVIGFHGAAVQALGRSLYHGELDLDAPPLDEARRLGDVGRREAWPLERMAGALVRLAVGAGATDREEDGLRALELAERFAPGIFADHPGVLAFQRMALQAGAGVNAVDRRDLPAAARHYAHAVALGLDLGLHPFARTYLEYLVDVGLAGGEELVMEMLLTLHVLGPRIETGLGAAGVEKLQALGLHLTREVLSADGVNVEVLHTLWQAVKGARFGRALADGAGRTLPDDAGAAELLEEIRALRSQVPLSREGTGPGSRIDRDLRLLAFVREATPAAGKTPAERLANLQHRFDQRLQARLVRAEAPSRRPPLSVDETVEALGPRTVLLSLYLGQLGEGRARVALLASRDRVTVHAVPGSGGLLMELTEGDRRETAFSYALDAFELRQALSRSAGPGRGEDRAPDGPAGSGGAVERRPPEAILEQAAMSLLGGLAPVLGELADEGYDHLCVVPHGPLHYLPLACLPAPGGVLADRWTVTSLPSLELLRSPARVDPETAPRPRRAGVAAFGLTFTGANPYRLEPLSWAADEARRIAAAFGEPAVLDDAVTEAAVTGALERARFVHIATHGALNLDAPAFQYLVLSPDAGSDGVLHAHELLRLDLRGLELVSLSACETALGRLDRSDNPRGLPAMLLLAGAGAVVGTLWEVRDDVARAFFVELYQRLADGASRLDAYGGAQREVRRRFPDPGDWGAFYYLGGW